MWYITGAGGERRTRLIEVSDERLLDLLFTCRGRRILGAAISEAWPPGTAIDFHRENFVHMPTIQVRDVKCWDDVPDDIIRNSTPWPTVSNRWHTSTRYHTMQIVRLDNSRNDRQNHVLNVDGRLADL